MSWLGPGSVSFRFTIELRDEVRASLLSGVCVSNLIGGLDIEFKSRTMIWRALASVIWESASLSVLSSACFTRAVNSRWLLLLHFFRMRASVKYRHGGFANVRTCSSMTSTTALQPQNAMMSRGAYRRHSPARSTSISCILIDQY